MARFEYLVVCCGRCPCRWLISFRVVLSSDRSLVLGGREVRKARRNFADPLERGVVFMYHDASTALCA